MHSLVTLSWSVLSDPLPLFLMLWLACAVSIFEVTPYPALAGVVFILVGHFLPNCFGMLPDWFPAASGIVMVTSLVVFWALLLAGLTPRMRQMLRLDTDGQVA